MKVAFLIPIAVSVVLLLGCGKSDSDRPNRETAKSPAVKELPPEDMTRYETFKVIKPPSFEGEFADADADIGLSPGQFSPDIRGTDLEGIEFKLSDYRGKVVVLFFWGDWYESSHQSFRQMRELAFDYRDASFAIVGVNNDDELEAAKNAVNEKKLIWRSFYDGHLGPIAEQYQIQFFPAAIVIDANGII